jgi:hypothetical protein
MKTILATLALVFSIAAAACGQTTYEEWLSQKPKLPDYGFNKLTIGYQTFTGVVRAPIPIIEQSRVVDVTRTHVRIESTDHIVRTALIKSMPDTERAFVLDLFRDYVEARDKWEASFTLKGKLTPEQQQKHDTLWHDGKFDVFLFEGNRFPARLTKLTEDLPIVEGDLARLLTKHASRLVGSEQPQNSDRVEEALLRVLEGVEPKTLKYAIEAYHDPKGKGPIWPAPGSIKPQKVRYAKGFKIDEVQDQLAGLLSR